MTNKHTKNVPEMLVLLGDSCAGGYVLNMCKCSCASVYKNMDTITRPMTNRHEHHFNHKIMNTSGALHLSSRGVSGAAITK